MKIKKLTIKLYFIIFTLEVTIESVSSLYRNHTIIKYERQEANENHI